MKPPGRRPPRHLGRLGWAVVGWSAYSFLFLFEEVVGGAPPAGACPTGLASCSRTGHDAFGIGAPAVLVMYVVGLVVLGLLSRYLRRRHR